MLDLWLVRHGETTFNSEKRWQGHIDVPLSEAGIAQAACLGRRLARTRFDACFASDLSRARTTAEIALPTMQVQLDPRLREICFGIFEGRAWSELSAEEQQELSAWWYDPYRKQITGGESFKHLEERIRAFVADLPSSGRIVAFTHGGVIRSLLWSITGPPEGRSWTVALENAGLTRLEIVDGRTTITCVNDCAHLEELAHLDS